MRQVTDPVCGMIIDADTAAAREDHGGETLYFCSEACAARFRQKPEHYLSRTGASAGRLPPRTTEGKFTAPMFGAAGSGGAEYEPIPEEDET
ncbi:MAG: YHS domain-containing protein [Gemmatimonadetes bacterium]|nr:YHS domain-containing protein [Gemmatimonadota bacterium]